MTTDNSKFEILFKSKLRALYPDVGDDDVVVQTKDFYKFLHDGDFRWALIPLRPDSSGFFCTKDRFNEIVVFDKRFGRSPWPAVFLRRGTGPQYLHYADLVPDEGFFKEGLKMSASMDFEEMAKQAFTTFNHGVYKNSEAVLQCGRGDLQRQVVKTPDVLYNAFDKVFHFTYDPCPLHPEKDAMLSDWGSMNYVNPPFTHTGAFAWRAAEQAAAHGHRTVLICPALVQQKWRTQLTLTGHIHAVVFLRSGIKFEGYEKKMPLPLNLLLIGPSIGPNTRKIPVFFWDPLSSTMRRKIPSSKQDWPAPLKSLPYWKDLA